MPCGARRAAVILDLDLVKPSRIVTLISFAVFIASLTQKGFSTAGEEPGSWSPGLYLLLIGPLGMLAGVFEWFANPFLLAAWIFSWFGKNKITLPLALIAIGLIVAFLFRQTMIVSEAPDLCKDNRLRSRLLALAKQRDNRDAQRDRGIAYSRRCFSTR